MTTPTPEQERAAVGDGPWIDDTPLRYRRPVEDNTLPILDAATTTGATMMANDIEGLVERLEELLYEHDPMCGGDDCRYTAQKIAQPVAEFFAPTITALQAEVDALIHDNAQLMKAANIEANRAAEAHAQGYAEAKEQAAGVCEAQRKVFASSEYATGQPLSSLQERFACGSCAEAIRAMERGEGNATA